MATLFRVSGLPSPFTGRAVPGLTGVVVRVRLPNWLLRIVLWGAYGPFWSAIYNVRVVQARFIATYCAKGE